MRWSNGTRSTVEETWTIKKTHNKRKWTGPEQYEDPTGKLMMLPSDLALVGLELRKRAGAIG